MSPIVITGELIEPARSGLRRADGQWVLSFALRAPIGPRGREVEAHVEHSFGTGEAAATACHARARRLKRGTRITVHARGACLRRGGISLGPVDLIDEPDLINLHERIAL